MALEPKQCLVCQEWFTPTHYRQVFCKIQHNDGMPLCAQVRMRQKQKARARVVKKENDLRKVVKREEERFCQYELKNLSICGEPVEPPDMFL